MIRTVEQYLESLNDGREVWCLGEKVKDVRTHPTIQSIIRASAMDFVLPHDKRFRHLFVTKDADGEDVNFLLVPPKSSEDLLRRRECFITGMRSLGGIVLHCMGIDALAACTVAANKMDKQLGTHYVERVETYRKYLQKKDLGITGAITDVKGDRGLRASKQVQHKDFYVRVVDRKKDGIIVRGAKVHISATPGANEAIVLPCRAHNDEDEKDYALAFATPLNAKGVKLLAVEPVARLSGEEAYWDYPISAACQPTECLIVFDDVFVPWERVFMCGEWQFSRDIAYAFATFHRLFGSSRMSAELETLTGSAALMAEYNGIEKYEHVRNKLAWLAMLTESVAGLSKMACIDCEKEPESGLVVPNRMYANIAKFTFADNLHEAMKIIQDISGGIPATVPAFKDWKNPEIQPYIEKYLAGKANTSTEDRLKASRLVKDYCASYHQVANIHGEGSLAAQRMFLYFGADWGKYKAAAKRVAHIEGWQKDPTYGPLPHPEAAIKLPPVDKSYEL
jgi:4-hydroxybutyryl-CoA dehydratase/vinylacetyl-CoA-Delta-isomerase